MFYSVRQCGWLAVKNKTDQMLQENSLKHEHLNQYLHSPMFLVEIMYYIDQTEVTETPSETHR